MYHRLAVVQTDYLALLELRLEAVRRPEIRASLTATIRGNLEREIAAHRESGLPGVLGGYAPDRLVAALADLVAGRVSG